METRAGKAFVERPTDARERCKIAVPFAEHGANYELLKEVASRTSTGRRVSVTYDKASGTFRVPRKYFLRMVDGLAAVFVGGVQAKASYNHAEVCHTKCQNAQVIEADECTCRCLGVHHRGGTPRTHWQEVGEVLLHSEWYEHTWFLPHRP